MNPRRRRAIARAILAGIPRSKLNSENIKKFLAREKAKGRLDLGPDSIEDILFPGGFVNKPIAEENTKEVETVVEDEQADADVDNVETEQTEQKTETEEVSYSLENTKSELQARADELGLEYKKSLSKSKLLELINNN